MTDFTSCCSSGDPGHVAQSNDNTKIIQKNKIYKTSLKHLKSEFILSYLHTTNNRTVTHSSHPPIVTVSAVFTSPTSICVFVQILLIVILSVDAKTHCLCFFFLNKSIPNFFHNSAIKISNMIDIKMEEVNLTLHNQHKATPWRT